ncbi:MAG: S9 family peptidase [Rhodothermales bacterium]|nr:S9 family peptidase [Rhodothermales bacterium]MBO6780315.1 S9 family peptidase [Rhodothermales bacterium]
MKALPAIVLALLVSTASAQERRALTVDDLFEIHSVGSPAVSPDGEWVAYSVRETSLEEESSETRLWMMPTAGGEAIPLTAKGGSAGSVAWSPDGRYISFTASRDGSKNQVWLLDRRGGEAQQLTEVEQGIGSYAWSPDASKLVLTITDPEEPDTLSGARAKTTKPYVIDRLQFKRDYAGYLTGNRKTHLYLFDVASREVTQLTDGRWDESSPEWSPDGSHIAFVSNRTDDPDTNSNSDIFVIAAEPGAEARRLTTQPGSDWWPSWSPDGSHIAYLRNLEPEIIWYDVNEIAVVDVATAESRSITGRLDRNARSPEFTEDGSRIRFILEDSGDFHLASADARTGRVTRMADGPMSVSSVDVSGGVTAALVSRMDLPGEIHVLEDGTFRQLSQVNADFLGGIELARVEDIQFESPDGTPVEGFVTFPIGYDSGQRYPTLLRIHGGPVSQYAHRFSFEAQLFAAHGYLVVQTNPRGSSGYGQDFSQALWADWGGPDFMDVMAGVDHAIARGWADPDRLGVGGWSYGGILTDHVITKTDRFKAAISGASEVLYRANYGHDHYQRQWVAELGVPWGETAENWERISPFNYVDRVTTPTLLMGGQDDWNVPIQNSEQLYQALRKLGVPTQLVVYPRQGHGLRVPSYQKDRYERYLEWYDRYLKPAEGTH